MRVGRGRIRKLGADYLAYALVDAIVDHYFEVLEALGEDIESVEREVIDKPSQVTLRAIHTLKRELIYLRRSVWPLRETVSTLLRDESDLVAESTRIFLRDLYDHSIQVLDAVETLRDIVSGMLDVYLSSASNKMNEIMKVLTVMSSIFIPLTFIAGVYGMNFPDMPGLNSPWGFTSVMVLMAAIAFGLLFQFHRRGWLRRGGL
jgi:magnesium transporter